MRISDYGRAVIPVRWLWVTLHADCLFDVLESKAVIKARPFGPYPSRSAQVALESACGKTRGIIESVSVDGNPSPSQGTGWEVRDCRDGTFSSRDVAINCLASAGLFFCNGNASPNLGLSARAVIPRSVV